MTLTREVYATQPGFGRIAATQFHDVPAPAGPPRTIQNRNVLLWLYPGAFGVKTGYTARRGLLRRRGGAARGPPAGRRGARDRRASRSRDAAALLNYGFAAFTPHASSRAGDAAGTVALPGGSVSVDRGRRPRRARPDALRRRATPDRSSVAPDAAYPPAPGEQVATMRGRDPRARPGARPAGGGDVPPPPRRPTTVPGGRGRPARSLDAVGGALRAAID